MSVNNRNSVVYSSLASAVVTTTYIASLNDTVHEILLVSELMSSN